MKCRNCKNNTLREEDGAQFTWCEVAVDNLDIDAERECAAYKPATNANRLRAMTDEELAEFICGLMSRDDCYKRCPAKVICYYEHTGMVDWLKREAQE